MTAPQFSTTNTDYGNVLHSTILTIFGDELTYNELQHYAKNKDSHSKLHIIIETNNHMDFQFVKVFINNEEIMDKKYNINHSCDMFYYLDELEKK